MNDELFAQAWNALHGDLPIPTALESSIDAVTVLLGLQLVELPTGHELQITEELFTDPWPEMIVGSEPEAASIAWTFRAAQLLPIGRGPAGEWLAVDEEEDPEGRNRVYQIGAGGRLAHLVFEDIDELLRWLIDPGPITTTEPDPWSREPASVERCLELLWRLHPTMLYQSYRLGVWPADRPDPPEIDPNSPGWRRLGVIWTLARFRQKQMAEPPPQVEVIDMTPTHMLLIERLEDLEEAILLDDVPTYLADLALEEDPEIAEAAQAWMESFDNTRADPKKSTAMMAEKTQGLLRLFSGAVDELVRLELIELIPQRKAKLVEELAEATLKLQSADGVIPLVIEHLLESRNVEEVFADDGELAKVLSVALGMG